MRNWYVGFNNWWFIGGIHLTKTPMILCFLEWLVSLVCYAMPSIPLPRIKFRLKNKDDWNLIENNRGWTDLKEWYGDIGQLWHLFVCIPVINLVGRHTKSVNIDLPYEFLKEKFPEEYTDYGSEYDEEENIERFKNKVIANNVNDQFKDVYVKLNFGYIKKKLKEKEK